MSTEISRYTTSEIDHMLSTSDGPLHWEEPHVFDLSEEAGRSAFGAERVARPQARVISRMDIVGDSLFKLQHPGKMHDQDARDAFTQQIAQERATYGNVFYFPWLDTFVQYADQDQHYALRTTRNQNAITLEEQGVLRECTVFIAGLSVGSNVDDAMMRLGIGNKRIYADMDTVEPTNFNRIDATMQHVGVSKVDLQAMKTSLRDPYVEQAHFREGVTRDNIEAIFAHGPEIVIDEVDDIATKALLRLYAKWHGVPVLMGTDVGKNSIIDVERYDTDARTVPFNGRISPAQFRGLIEGTMSAEEQRKLTLSIVGIRNVTTRMLTSAARIGKTLSGMPQPGTTASTSGNLVAEMAGAVFLGQPVKSGRHTSSVRKILGLKSTEGPLDFIRALQEFRNAGKAPSAN